MKHLIEKFWDENTCGLIENNENLSKKEYFDQLSKIRYAAYSGIKKYAPFNNYKNKKVLEVGLGAGSDAVEFIKGGANYYGIDVTKKSVNFLRERLSYTFDYKIENIKKNDSTEIDFLDNFFDLVYSFGVIHHIEDTKKVVSEFKRVLKPSGKIFIMIYNRSSIFYKIEICIFRRLLIIISNIKFFRILVLALLGKKNKIKITNYINNVNKRYNNKLFLSNQELLNISSDHANCPLAKVYNKKEAIELFKDFKSIKTYAFYNEKDNSIFWQLFNPFLKPFENFLSKNYGWFRIVECEK